MKGSKMSLTPQQKLAVLQHVVNKNKNMKKFDGKEEEHEGLSAKDLALYQHIKDVRGPILPIILAVFKSKVVAYPRGSFCDVIVTSNTNRLAYKSFTDFWEGIKVAIGGDATKSVSVDTKAAATPISLTLPVNAWAWHFRLSELDGRSIPMTLTINSTDTVNFSVQPMPYENKYHADFIVLAFSSSNGRASIIKATTANLAIADGAIVDGAHISAENITRRDLHED